MNSSVPPFQILSCSFEVIFIYVIFFSEQNKKKKSQKNPSEMLSRLIALHQWAAHSSLPSVKIRKLITSELPHKIDNPI